MNKLELTVMIEEIKKDYAAYFVNEEHKASYGNTEYTFVFDNVKAIVRVDNNSMYFRINKFNDKMILPIDIISGLITPGIEMPAKLDMLRAIFEMCKEM